MSQVYISPSKHKYRIYNNLIQRYLDGRWSNSGTKDVNWFKASVSDGYLTPCNESKIIATKSASDFLMKQQEILMERGKQRDSEEGERSMAKTVAAFNLLFDKDLTEKEGWEFMVLLKTVRSTQGEYHEDDYQDKLGYTALAAEAASKEHECKSTK